MSPEAKATAIRTPIIEAAIPGSTKAGLAQIRSRWRTLRNARPERKHATHQEKSPLESHSHHPLL